MKNKALTRRSTLAALAGAGGAALFIAAWNETVEAADMITCVPATPTVTEGPYWVDEKLFRSDIRTDPNTRVVRAGVPLALTINVENLLGGCSALSGAYVDIWHCDAKGIYSDESTYNPGGGAGSVNTLGQKFRTLQLLAVHPLLHPPRERYAARMAIPTVAQVNYLSLQRRAVHG
jgi:protocatechuate 3,4-dioxygenase beta subunit